MVLLGWTPGPLRSVLVSGLVLVTGAAGAGRVRRAAGWLIALPRVGTDLPTGLTRGPGGPDGIPARGTCSPGTAPLSGRLLATGPLPARAFGTRVSMAAATVLPASLMGLVAGPAPGTEGTGGRGLGGGRAVR